MDECGLIADLTDKDLLDKMNTAFGTHPHYVSWKTGKDKQLNDKQFKLKHYAGDVSKIFINKTNKKKLINKQYKHI